MSYKPKNASENKKAVVHLLCYLLLSNIASHLEETGLLNSSCSLACNAKLTHSPLFPFFNWLLIYVDHSV